MYKITKYKVRNGYLFLGVQIEFIIKERLSIKYLPHQYRINLNGKPLYGQVGVLNKQEIIFEIPVSSFFASIIDITPRVYNYSQRTEIYHKYTLKDGKLIGTPLRYIPV